ncbi:Alpha/Beta hydrolase protein [Aspergillus crustosus]
MALSWPSILSLLTTLTISSLATSISIPTLHWTPCPSNPIFDCTTLKTPLEYANTNTNTTILHATIPLARYNATAPKSAYKGFLLTNPGGPGSSGIDFLINGAGEGISNITDGVYDIISWDPRGVGSAEPLLTCFDTIGEETEAYAAVPLAAEIEYTQFRNASYMPEYRSQIRSYDTAVGELAESCAEYNSPALYTSSAAYVVRDMAAIIDALEGKKGAKLNYWGFSYGTILGAEFIQTYPERVGRVVLDGVFDAEANAETYTSQLPNDELFVRDAIDDFARLCEQAGPETCAFSTPATAKINTNTHSNTNANATIQTRLSTLQATLHTNPITVPATNTSPSWPLTSAVFSFFLYSFLKLPPSYPIVTTALSRLETGDPTLFATLLTGATTATIPNASAPAVGSISGWPIQCIDNAPSNNTTLKEVSELILDLSLQLETPWLNADLSTLSFCRNFPNTRPLLPNLGASKLLSGETNSVLTALNMSVLIVNPEHDPTTPVTSAKRLQSWLPTSSQLLARRGPGHTSISLGSIGLVQSIREYFVNGDLTLPARSEAYEVSQMVFGKGVGVEAESSTPEGVFPSALSERERELLGSTYNLFRAFMGLP